MDLEFSQNNVVVKFPLLKQGEYEMWKLRIEQYFQVQDYALWDVIENGNSFKPVPQTTANADGTSTLIIPGPVTTEEKAQKKNDVKDISMLLMALPNEHLLTFSQYKNARTLFEATQARFGGNDATKKTQRTLLKQMYKNFNAPSIESLDSIFNMLQKIISQLAILANLDTMSIDDLYNNFKIVEQEVKRTVTSSSSSGSQNMAFLSSPGSTNEVDTANIQISTISTSISTVNSHDNIANLSDATVYFQRTDKKITINGSDTPGYDKTKVECFSCHKMRHFARECRSPRNKESMPRNQDNSRKTVNVEDTSSKAMVVIDGAGFDRSYMADRAATPISADRPINTATPKPLVNVAKPRQNALQKSHSLSRKPFYQQTALKNRNLNNTINTAKGDPQDALKDTRIFNSGCSKHMIGNKSYLTDYQEYDRGFVAFAGSSKGERKATQSLLIKGIKREFSNARTLQQNRVAERKNRTLIEAAKTMLADSLLPIPFWSEAVNTHCYVQNKVLVTKTHNKTPYELLTGRKPIISFMRPFGCPVTILNTLDHLGKFDGKADEEFLVGYSINSKAFRVYNSRTRKVEENLHVNFLENKPNVAGSGLEWLFDIDSLTSSMNYQPVSEGNRTNGNTGAEINSDVRQAREEKVPDQEYILLPLLNTCSNVPSSHEEVESPLKNEDGKKSTVKPTCVKGGKTDDLGSLDHQMKSTDDSENTNSTNSFSTASPTINVASNKDGTFQRTMMNGTFQHPLQLMLLMEPKKVTRALDDKSWVEAIQEELFQFKLLNVLTLVSLPHRKRAIGTKWVYRNKRDQRGIIARNKASLVAQGHRQEEGIDYDEVFAPLARIKAIRLFLAYASFMDFTVYQMDMKSVFLYGTIEEEVYVSQPPGFVDLEFPNRVYKIKNDILLVQVYVDDIIFVSTRSVKSAGTPMETHKPLSKDANGIDVDVHLYSSMIGSLIYLTSSRPDIMFAVCSCLRFQVQPKVSHMHAVKRIFRYLKDQPTLGLWYPKDTPLELIAYFDSDYAGANLDRKSITGGCQFLDSRLISWRTQKDTGLPQTSVPLNLRADEVVHQERGDSVERAITTDASLEAAHASDNILKTQTMTMPNVNIPQGMDTGGRPRRQETMGGHTSRSGEGRMEHTVKLTDIVPPTPHDSPLTGGSTPGSDKGRLKLEELIDLCTTLSNRVFTLENKLSSTKVVNHKAFITLTKRVKKLETQLKHKKSRAVIPSSDEEEPSVDIKDSPKQGRMIKELEKDEDVNLVSEQGEVQETAEPSKDEDDATLAETLINIKRKEEVEAQVGSDQEVEEMKIYIRIVPDEYIAIDAIPLATKPPVIVEYKIVMEGRIDTYHIIRADKSTKRYTSMINLLENINREDLEALWKLVKDKHGNTRLEEGYERVL
uniref:CCHC-type domain-containing protein n=1 Tax=Tanacetum cinerariifolium TaxID=118510 RepID=A0A6L2KCG1_TANCI|nr:hypothetical protein [Tanacetum cinerariifolium]